MANQQNSYTVSDGSGTDNRDFSYTFPSFLESEVKVEIDNVVKTLTTHYTIENHNNTSGGTVRFNATGLPNGTAGTTPVRIFRQTDVETPKAEFTAGSSLKAQEINDNFKQVRHALQEAIGATYNNSGVVTSRQVQRYNIEADAIDGTLIADDVINSEHYAAGSIDLEHMSANSVDSDQYVDGSIDRVHLEADIIDSTKLADNSVNSEHYVDGSIDREHLASDIVDGTKIADDSINSEHYVAASIDHEHLANDIIDSDNIQDNAINSEHYVDGSIRADHLASSAVTNSAIANNSIQTGNIVDGAVQTAKIGNVQVTTAKLANDAVTSAKLADDAVLTANILDDAVTADKIASNAVTNTQLANDSVQTGNIVDSAVQTAKINNSAVNSSKLADDAVITAKIANDAVTADKIADAVIVTASEQAAASANDTTFFTTSASDARYFNVSTGDTIKDGDTFPDNDTTIATTAAINDRIIDIVDDIGGFVPLVDEGEIPQYHPEKENAVTSDRVGTILSIGTLTTTYTPSGGTVTIQASDLTNHSVNATITDCGSTVLSSGYGVLIETKAQTDSQYAAGPSFKFHRLVPKATEVTTVAGISGNVTTVAGIAANTTTVAGISSNVTTVAGIASNVTSVANNESNINSAVSNASNINSAVSNASNINTVAGSISNVNSVGGSIANVNTTASNLANVNNFAATYQIASSAPPTDGAGNALAAGDLYFDTSSNELRVHNGTTFQGGVTATGNLAGLGANTFTGNQTITNTNPKLLLTDTDANSDYSIHVNSGNFQVKDETTGTNQLRIHSDGTFKVTGNLDAESGLDVTGNITVSGNVDGRDVAADGTKLDGIESSATADQTASEIVALVADQTIAPSTIDMEDNEKIKLGTGDDLQLYHDGVDNHIDASQTLSIKMGGETSAQFDVNGAVSLYYDNSKKFETYTFGTKTTGLHSIVTSDNSYLALENTAGHGTAYVRNYQGDLLIESPDNVTIESGSSEIMAHFIGDGAAQLYYDNSKKFETSSSGVTVTGDIAVTGTVDGIDIATDVAANTAKVTNATHTGDVTGATSLTIANDAVTTAKIADDAVTSAKIANNAITTALINNSEVTNAKLAANAVTADKINDGEISTAKIADDAVTAAKLANTSVSAGSYGSSTAIPAITVDAQGRITAASTNTVNTTTNLGASAGTDSILITSSTGTNVSIPEATSSTAGVMTVAHHDKLDGIASSANNYSHPNHSGEVTSSGDGATTIADNVVDEANLKVSNSPVNGYMLTAQSGNTGGLTWAPAAAGATGASNDEIFWENGTNVTADYTITNGKNAGSFGPITIDSGVTVTVGSGETWTVV